MGVLTDFFIGDDNTARNVDDILPPGHADRIDMKGIQHVELEMTPDFFDIFVEGCQFKPMDTELGRRHEHLVSAGGSGRWPVEGTDVPPTP